MKLEVAAPEVNFQHADNLLSPRSIDLDEFYENPCDPTKEFSFKKYFLLIFQTQAAVMPKISSRVCDAISSNRD